jgi:DNA polymerase-1
MNREQDSRTLFLVDGSSYLYRAFFAVRGLTSHEGLPTNAIFGFVNMILKIINERSPTHMAVVFDTKAPTFRQEIYPDYKAHRPPIPEDLAVQIPYIKKILKAMRIPLLEMEGFEADDVIGTLSRMASEEGRSTVIVSSDKDFFQLLSDQVLMWDTMKDVTLDPSYVEERFGVPPDRVLEVLALIGDASDNIPGIPGVGEKTAVKLINEYGDIETLLKKWEEISQPRLREAVKKDGDKALLARTLMAIKKDVSLGLSLDNLKMGAPDMEELVSLFTKLDFQKFLEQIQPPKKLERSWDIIDSAEQLEQILSALKGSEVISIDLETNSTDPMAAEIVAISLSWSQNRAVYIPIAHTSAAKQMPLDTVLDVLRPILEASSPGKVGQNIKYDYIILQRYGVALGGIIFDTMVGSYLIDPDRHAHNLENIARDFLGERIFSFKEVVGTGRKAIPFQDLPLEQAAAYGGQDAEVTLRLYYRLKEALMERDLLSLMEKVELPLIMVLARMEQWGVKIDIELMRSLSKEFEERLSLLEEEIYKLAGETFNINSTKQLGYILFEKLGLPHSKKTKKKTGYSTDTEVMALLAPAHPIAAEILNYRTLSKLKSTYIDALPKLVNPRTGRVHTSYNQTVTATGRLSSSDPNLQNIPARGEEAVKIRQAFIPEAGCKLISADYSQIELRVLAHYSQDPTLHEAFNKGEDVHLRTACEVFNVDSKEVTADMRRQAKVINFGIIYGMSAFGLARQLNIGKREAETYIRNYFARLPGVQRFIKENLLKARINGYVTTLLNRRRYVPQIKSRNRAVASIAERLATNTPIQGSAADIIKVAMINILRAFDQANLRAKMILQVHDELVFEVPEEELDQAQAIIRDRMEKAVSLSVPLVIDMKVGKNWAEAH